jgi:hypothetical protein
MTIPIPISGDGKGRGYMELLPQLVVSGNAQSSLTVDIDCFSNTLHLENSTASLPPEKFRLKFLKLKQKKLMQSKLPGSSEKMKQLQVILLRKSIYLQIVLKMKEAMMMQTRLKLIVEQKSLNNVQLEQYQKPQLKILQLMLVGNKQHFDELQHYKIS